MPEKPETRFYRKVHQRLPETVHRQKQHNLYGSGEPDCYYEGPKSDLRIEYKWLTRAQRAFTPALSPSQHDWIERAHRNGRPVAVVVGSPAGAVILPGIVGFDRQTNVEWTKSVADVADWIQSMVLP